jgi:hypothetical protein
MSLCWDGHNEELELRVVSLDAKAASLMASLLGNAGVSFLANICDIWLVTELSANHTKSDILCTTRASPAVASMAWNSSGTAANRIMGEAILRWRDKRLGFESERDCYLHPSRMIHGRV